MAPSQHPPELERARAAVERHAWAEAGDLLARAAAQRDLEAEDLERLATVEYMLGRDEGHHAVLEQAHQAYLARGEPLRAAHAAIWLGLLLAARGEMGRAGGWLARGQRLVESEPQECVEGAYLAIATMFGQQAAGLYAEAAATAAAAVDAAQRFGDRDLFALAVHSQGRLMVLQGRIEEGLRLLDEAMVAVTSGEVSPIPSGIVYCGVISGCQAAYAPGRAREWTAALTRWCDHQPDMVAFTGTCLVHRAEILQLEGAWAQALEAARDAAKRCTAAGNERAAADAAYRRGEIHRLRGEHEAAAEAFRAAGVAGCEPQPGLALLRLADGDGRAAAAALERVLAETTEWPRRVQLLPAHVEVMLAIGEQERAHASARELEAIAGSHGTELVAALAAQASGAVALAGGDAAGALPALRRAWRTWVDVGAPYEAAAVRLRTGLACRALGDEDTAALELEAARAVFEQLGAAPDRVRAEGLLGRQDGAHGLTARELEILRRVAAGATNKAIAAELVLSDRTVDRHVSNILMKLRVSSRAGATARAYEDRLL